MSGIEDFPSRGNHLIIVAPGTGADLAEQYLAMPGDDIITLHECEFTGQKTLIEDVLGPKYAYVHAWHGVQSARAYAEGVTFALWVLEQSGETTVIKPESVDAFRESLRQEEEKLGAEWVPRTLNKIDPHNHEYLVAAFTYAQGKWAGAANFVVIAALEVYEALNAQAEANAINETFGGPGEDAVAYVVTDEDGREYIDVRLLPNDLQPEHDSDGMSHEMHRLVAKGLAFRFLRNRAQQGDQSAIERLADDENWCLPLPQDWQAWLDRGASNDNA